MAAHIAAVMQRRERIENRHLDRLFQPRPQIVGVALALDLGPHPRHELVRIDRANDIVVDAHIEAPKQLGVVARLHHDHDRQVPGAVERAHLRAKPQAVGILQAEADDHQVEIAVRQGQQGPRRIGLPLDPVLVLQRVDHALGRTVAILDKENAAAAPELVESDAQGGGETHLLLGRGAHQHLVGEHFQPSQVLYPGNQGDVVDRLGKSRSKKKLSRMNRL